MMHNLKGIHYILFILMVVITTPVYAQKTVADFNPGGSVIVGPDTRSCSGSLEGAMRYSGGTVQVCDGTTWAEPSGGGGGGGAGDTTPNSFSFIDVTDSIFNIGHNSNNMTITGIDSPTLVTISGDGDPSIKINYGIYKTEGAILNNDIVQVRATAPNAANTTRTITLTVGTVSASWDITTGEGGGASCPDPGDVCPDGSVFAGQNLINGDTMTLYTTPADLPGTYAYNNGNTTGYTDVTGAKGDTEGEANTTFLISADSDSITGGTQPHLAAQACADLVAHGHSDWYLPAQREGFYVLAPNVDAIGGFSNAIYSSSTQWNSNIDRIISWKPNSSSLHTQLKSEASPVRCVRRN